MSQTVYADKTSLTGGLASSLDGIDGALLLDGDMALVTTAEVLYILRLDDNLGGAEASPRRILPDTNPGTKVWVLQKACIDGIVVTGGTNTLNLTNGTASLDVAAGAAVDVNANLTVTAATSLDEAVAMSSKATAVVGDWTPGISFGGGVTGITYAADGQKGFYTLLGNVVTVSGRIELTAKGSSTGAAVITGLPYTVKNDACAYTPATVWLNVVTFVNQFMARVGINTKTIALHEITEAGVASNLDDTNFANTSQVMFSCMYRIA